MKALLGAFNQEKALVEAFSVIVKTDCETDGALHSASSHLVSAERQQLPGRHKVRIGLQQLGPAIVADEGLAGDTRPSHHLVSVAHQVGPRPTRQPW